MPAAPVLNPVRAYRPSWLVAGLVALVAFLLRLGASLDEFWLDEIWSWALVREQARSPLDILLVIRHDNNHPLNSLWLYLLGPDVDWRWYRLPAVLFGTATVLLARQIVRSDGPQAVAAITVLMLPAYLLIHYSSEARGYAGLLFFFAAATLLLTRLLPAAGTPLVGRLDRRWWLQIVGFWLCLTGGMLSHASFVSAEIALGLWSLTRIVRTRGTWTRRATLLALLFGVPLLNTALLWLVNLSGMQIGGGGIENPWLVAAQTASLMLGGPAEGEGILLVAGVVAVALLCQLIHQWRVGDDRWVLWLALLVVPGVLIVVLGRQEVYPRYFLTTVLGVLLALGDLLGRALTRGGVPRWVALGLLAAATLGNGLHLSRLYRDGRGHVGEALHAIAAETPGSQIVIGSDHPFRHGLVLAWHARTLPSDKRVIHLGTGPWPPGGPDWVLLHSQELGWQPDAKLTDGEGRVYEGQQVYPYAGLSGWNLAVYRNVRLKPTIR